jgi:hypothetical protein
MNSVHDMGGMHGMGFIEADPNEPVFHEPWKAASMLSVARTQSVGSRTQLGQFSIRS